MTLRTLVFRLLPLCYQIVAETPWTIEQADEAESLVRQIRAASIVEMNAESEDVMTDDDARRAMR